MQYTLFAAGGYIVQTIGVNGLAPGRQKLEASMRKLHDEGKWIWKETRHLEKYMRPYNEGEEGGESGVQFIFKVKNNSLNGNA